MTEFPHDEYEEYARNSATPPANLSAALLQFVLSLDEHNSSQGWDLPPMIWLLDKDCAPLTVVMSPDVHPVELCYVAADACPDLVLQAQTVVHVSEGYILDLVTHERSGDEERMYYIVDRDHPMIGMSHRRSDDRLRWLEDSGRGSLGGRLPDGLKALIAV